MTSRVSASPRGTGLSTALLVAAALLAGCRYTPTPVVLHAAPADIAPLAGTWEGTYQSQQSERTGTITFTIEAGKDTASGDVLMEGPPQQRFLAADVANGDHRMRARAPEVLRITWVGLHRGYVEGALEPYIAPDCQCTVKTVFRGSVVGDGSQIKGEYLTTGTTIRQTGTWIVRRKP
jgi:hypothetical protein